MVQQPGCLLLIIYKISFGVGYAELRKALMCTYHTVPQLSGIRKENLPKNDDRCGVGHSEQPKMLEGKVCVQSSLRRDFYQDLNAFYR